jgi:hypothetical protein
MRLVLHKNKSLSLCCNKSLCSLKIPKGNSEYVFRTLRIIKLIAIFSFVAEVIFTLIDFLLTISTAPAKTGATSYSEIETFNALDVIQIILTAIVMYCLVLYDRLIKKIVKRDDPFSNAAIYNLVIFIVILQKYLVELIFMKVIDSDEVIIVIRQTLMSI